MSDPLLTPAEAYAEVQALVARGGWLALDTETTGLEPHDQVIDIAVLDEQGRTYLESLVSTTIPMHPEVIAKTGLTPTALDGAPSWDYVWTAASMILAGREVVAFNAEFDRHAIEQTCRAHGLPMVEVRWTCAQQLLSPLWSRGHVSLARVCRDLGIAPGTHRALSDARAMVLAVQAVAASPMVVRPRDPPR